MTANAWNYVCRTGVSRRFEHREPAPASHPDVRVSLIDPFFGPMPPGEPLSKALMGLPSDVLTVDLLVLRGLSAEYVQLEAPTELANRIASQTGAPPPAIATLEFRDNPSAFLPRLEILPVTKCASTLLQLRDQIRSLEAIALLHKSTAIYRASKVHYELPSGAHSNVYVRAGDIFDDAVAVARIADWLQDSLPAQGVLLGDTYTILPLLQELLRRHERRDPNNGISLHADPALRLLTFPSYPTLGMIQRTLESIPALLSHASDPRVLFVISVTASGQLVRSVDALSPPYLPGIPIDRIALVSTQAGDTSLESLTQLNDVKSYAVHSNERCELCRLPQHAPIVRIDGKKYFPHIEVSVHEQMLTTSAASRHKAFWETASVEEAVEVHSDYESPGKHRHLMIALRVERLLKNVAFRAATSAKLRRFVPDPDVVFLPDHENTPRLREFLREVFPPRTKVIPLSREPSNQRNAINPFTNPDATEEIKLALRGARTILLFDEVVITGETLRHMHRFIQDTIQGLDPYYRPHREYRLKAFVVVARPERSSEWDYLKDALRQDWTETHIDFGEKLLLPNEHCPWCDEIRFWNDNSAIGARLVQAAPLALDAENLGAAEGVIKLRRDKLMSREGPRTGMQSCLFLCNKSGATAERKPEHLSLHSLFGEELSESAAFAAVAGAVQELREQATEMVSTHDSHAWCWNLARIVHAYHDPLLQCAFLRAALPSELLLSNAPDAIQAIRGALFPGDVEQHRQSAALAAEHFFAAVSRKLPPAARTAVMVKALETIGDNSDLGKLFDALSRAGDAVVTSH